MYTGVAPGSSETGYSALIIGSCIGNAIQFILSAYITAEANLYVIMTMSLLAVPLFSVADIHFGSGRNRLCCGKKQAVETSGRYEHDRKPNGNDTPMASTFLATANSVMHVICSCLNSDRSSIRYMLLF